MAPRTAEAALTLAKARPPRQKFRNLAMRHGPTKTKSALYTLTSRKTRWYKWFLVAVFRPAAQSGFWAATFAALVLQAGGGQTWLSRKGRTIFPKTCSWAASEETGRLAHSSLVIVGDEPVEQPDAESRAPALIDLVCRRTHPGAGDIKMRPGRAVDEALEELRGGDRPRMRGRRYFSCRRTSS